MSGLDKHTHTHDNYSKPRCACTPRVNKNRGEASSIFLKNEVCNVNTEASSDPWIKINPMCAYLMHSLGCYTIATCLGLHQRVP